MPEKNQNSTEPIVFLLTRAGNDARNAAAVLEKVAIRTRICASVSDLCDHADHQTGAIVIGEETLDQHSIGRLLEFVVLQPAWSDIPIILLTTTGDIHRKTSEILDFLGARANITLLEKPLRAITLISATKAALRSRGRQYEIRSLLQSYSSAVEDAQTATAKFRAVFEQSPVFAGIMTLDGVVTAANRLWLDVCGYREEEVIGMPFWECDWWRGAREVQDKIRKGVAQAATGVPYREVLPYRWVDDTKRTVEFALHPIRGEAGQVIFLHPTGVDVTELRQATARGDFLGHLTQKLSVVSDPAEINQIATHEIGQFLDAHRCYFLQPLDDPGEVWVMPDWRRENEPCLEGTHRLDEFGRPELWQALRSGPATIDDVASHPWTKEFLPNFHAAGITAITHAPFIREGRWVVCIAVASNAPRRWTDDEQSLLENAVARVWPLIERARAERALREANALLADKARHLEALVKQRTAKLQDTVADLEAFSYSIAHDMRAPLRSLQGFATLLMMDQGKTLAPDGQMYLQRISKASERMDKLVRDVLSYSGVVRADLSLERVEMEQLLRGIVETYPMLAPDKADVRLRGPFPAVTGNEALLTQIFSNLMGNGAKFVAPGIKPRLDLWAEPRGLSVRLYVQDNGIGIAPDHHEKIFAIFQRVNKNFEGTGIGLAIVKKAAERIGGKVGLQSELDHGSTFWVDLQAAAAE